MTFKEAIDKNNFEHAIQMVENSEDILKSQWQFKLSDTYTKLVREKQFNLLNVLIEKGHIDLDIFEYDSFDNTIFKELLSLDNSAESLDFLSSFIGQVENLNDSLQDKSWLSLAVSEKASIDIVSTMIDNGCDANYVSRNGNTLLHMAKNKETIQLLLDQGLDVNRANDSGDSCLLANVSLYDTDVYQLFLDYGADPNMPNKQGKTMFSILINEQMRFDLAEKIAETYPPDFDTETGKSSDIFYDFINGYSPNKSHLSFFQMHGANPDKISQDSYGKEQTVWDIVIKKDFDFFEAFIDTFQPEINQVDNNGDTLLHKVCAFDVNFEQNKAKDTYRKAKKLISLGADSSITNTEDLKPIDLASKDNLKEKTVALLLKNS